jgi:hypothetical protein
MIAPYLCPHFWGGSLRAARAALSPQTGRLSVTGPETPFSGQAGPWSVPGVAAAGLGCLQAADEGVEAGGEPLVAVL